jgi:hypothetical protein
MGTVRGYKVTVSVAKYTRLNGLVVSLFITVLPSEPLLASFVLVRLGRLFASIGVQDHLSISRFGFGGAEHARGRCKDGRLAALDWLDVMYPAAIPMRAEPAATRCGEMVE